MSVDANARRWAALTPAERAFAEKFSLHPALLRYGQQPRHNLRTKDDCRGFQILLALEAVVAGRLDLARDIVRAPTYLWHASVWRAVPSAPADSVVDMPHPGPLLFFFEGSARVECTDGGVCIGFLVYSPAHVKFFRRSQAPVGTDERIVCKDIMQDFWHSAIAGRLAFLASPCVEKQELHTDRALRRRAAREASRLGMLSPDDGERVFEVVLRRPRSRGVSADAAGHVEWSCQWVVRAHWRRLASGRLILIHPYWKGPEGKPVGRRHYRVVG